jgi:hypothetical protein
MRPIAGSLPLTPNALPLTSPLTPYVHFLTGSSAGSYDGDINHHRQPSIL